LAQERLADVDAVLAKCEVHNGTSPTIHGDATDAASDWIWASFLLKQDMESYLARHVLEGVANQTLDAWRQTAQRAARSISDEGVGALQGLLGEGISAAQGSAENFATNFLIDYPRQEGLLRASGVDGFRSPLRVLRLLGLVAVLAAAQLLALAAIVIAPLRALRRPAALAARAALASTGLASKAPGKEGSSPAAAGGAAKGAAGAAPASTVGEPQASGEEASSAAALGKEDSSAAAAGAAEATAAA